MKNSFLNLIVLYCLHKIDGERSIYSILHLLKGKKSAQTIQDAHFFQLTNLFNSFPFLERTNVDHIVARIKDRGFIRQISEQGYRLTTTGTRFLEESLSKQPIPVSLNGLKYHQVTDLFWERLSLTVQVMSYLKSRETKYLPIQRKKEVHYWVKNFLQQTSLKRDELCENLYNELVQCLGRNKEIDPSILVMRLTGNKIIGLTPLQAAERLNLEFDVYQIQFKSLIHFMLELIRLKPETFPLLSKFISDDSLRVSLTQTAKRTFSMLKNGMDINEIVQSRKLKRSTIEDHIVEIALNDKKFEITPFVCNEKQQLILDVVKTNTTKQLKQIRELVPNADYFEIRLTLARAGEVNEA
ncbi:helix-turn-helix domain-containing protein [Bacillus sp. DTU_2020_1000418_1_SI_GHA_SEK_038]|uniref:helix-turn-helix domain-containing protein n=1 Tax=Bacillus sp. DTU_2020_1000418_1_SI_GHA_SEK_038 TaxID=3077585 RepID=UPI0028E72138|nr:helix-turn-helix domain-containing protein [Bacillus sp. DTU_2020_1000418_1_SI_GHA_SEK_038]WNS74075.1 helix-turn-helix domain-containing protein [Bacillus sp. DTU_2020_1000418_1_SI_GHA_SEK_038]